MSDKLIEMLDALKGLNQAERVEDGYLMDGDAMLKALTVIFKYGSDAQKERMTEALEEWYDNTRKGTTD